MQDLEFNVYKVESPLGEWLAAFEDKELVFLGSYAAGKKLVEGDLAKFFKELYGFKLGKFTPAKWTKGNFWNKKHKVKVMGTDFQMKVWLDLLSIPEGETRTYSDVAKRLKKPSATRAVASAVAKNPIAYWIPCHRVVGKGASKLKYRWGSKLKSGLLEMEGALN